MVNPLLKTLKKGDIVVAFKYGERCDQVLHIGKFVRLAEALYLDLTYDSFKLGVRSFNEEYKDWYKLNKLPLDSLDLKVGLRTGKYTLTHSEDL